MTGENWICLAAIVSFTIIAVVFIFRGSKIL